MYDITDKWTTDNVLYKNRRRGRAKIEIRNWYYVVYRDQNGKKCL